MCSSDLFDVARVAYAASEESTSDLPVPPRAVVPRDAPLRVAPAVLARLGQASPVGMAGANLPSTYGRIVVERATTFRVVDDGFPFQMRAAATTVEEALGVVGMALNDADTVLPARTAPLANGLKVTVVRAPVIRIVDQGSAATRSTRAATVEIGRAHV